MVITKTIVWDQQGCPSFQNPIKSKVHLLLKNKKETIKKILKSSYQTQGTVGCPSENSSRNRPTRPLTWQLELFVPLNITLCPSSRSTITVQSHSECRLSVSSVPFLFRPSWPAIAAEWWLHLLKLEIWAHYVNRCYRQRGAQAWGELYKSEQDMDIFMIQMTERFIQTKNKPWGALCFTVYDKFMMK